MSARTTEELAIALPRLLEALLSSPSTVLVGVGLDGLIDQWSLGAEHLYGWTAEQVLGQPIDMLVPEHSCPSLPARERLLAGEDVPPFETQRVARDGSLLDVELHVVLVRDTDGAPAGTVALHRDLRRTQRAEHELSTVHGELRARFADSPVPQARVALDGRIGAVNAAMEQLLGRPRGELVGIDGLQLFPDGERPEVEEALQQLRDGAATHVQQEHTVRRPDGSCVRIVITVTLVADPEGSAVLACSVEDVTALRAAEAALREQAELFDALTTTMPVVVMTYDLEGRCTSARGALLDEIGLGGDALVGRSLIERYRDLPDVLAALRASLRGEEGRALADAQDRVWKIHVRPLRDRDGVVVGGMGIATDVTRLAMAEREVRANEARLQSLLRYASDVVLVVDLDGRIVYASAAARDQLGYDESAVVGREATDFNHPADRRMIRDAWRGILQKPGATARFECRVLHADGSWRWADHVLTNLLEDPAVRGVVVNVSETTDRRRADEELRRLAVRDTLTGLANRTLLLDRVDRALVVGRRSGATPALVVLDVVGMTAFNEQLGQAGGDQVLAVVAARLEAAVGPHATVARVGGGHFGVLIDDVGSEEDLRAQAAALLDVVDEPIQVGDGSVRASLRVGTSLAPAADAGALLAAAERAAVQGRSAPRVQVLPGSADAEGASTGRPATDALRRAISQGELVLQFQPLLRLSDARPVGAEALVRWQHPERGLLLPAAFVPLAESSGLVVELGAWVLRTACEQLARWQDAGRDLSVGINLSPRQLVGRDFPDLVRAVLAETGVPPERIVLEVTESAVMDDARAPEVLRSLHDLGLRLALDDFGTGYSSLTYLKRFPIDAIKIDRSFVAGLGRDTDDEAIVASVVSLARAVGKTVVAEGVETTAHLDGLRALGVDQGQGFLWSRALSADELDGWLAAHRPVPSAPTPAPVTPAPVVLSGSDSGSDSDQDRILALHQEGASLHTIAAALNAEGRRTPAGPRWTTKTVARVVAALQPPV